MSFWSWMNNTPVPAANPGDAHGVTVEGDAVAARALPTVWPSAWDGWPADWNTPAFNGQCGLSTLIDVAWSAIDLNSSVLASMPVYRLRNGEIIPPLEWMINPDPMIYASWFEFAKELFWNFQLGEVFVLSMSSYADGWPQQLRVIPPWLVTVELRNGSRQYFLGGVGGADVTDAILHIRYQSSIDDAHGHGPLECAGARMTAAGLLQRYAARLAETGGTPHYWLGVDRRLNQTEANDLLAQWVESRTANAGYPALLSGGATLNSLQSMSAKDMALLELSQWNESRIAVALGVPPFLVGLPSGGDSMTYANQEQIFSFHDRSSLRPKAAAVMSALSNWALPRSQTVELNRDEYSRPGLKERAEAWKILAEIGVVDAGMVRTAERIHGEPSAAALTGANTSFNQQPTRPAQPGSEPPQTQPAGEGT